MKQSHLETMQPDEIRAILVELEQTRRLLVLLEDTARVHLDLPHNALPDATDNSGRPYQSQWAADLFANARAAISPIGGDTP